MLLIFLKSCGKLSVERVGFMKESNKRNPLNNFDAQFKKATLQLLILSILSDEEMYAYEIAQTILERSGGKYKAPLLYTSISKLEAYGFVTESRKESVSNRMRVYYMITDSGLSYLSQLKGLYKDLTDVVYDIDYCDEHPGCTTEDLEEEFGTPEEIANEFLESKNVSNSGRIKKLRNSRRLIAIIAVVLVVVLIAVIAFYRDVLSQSTQAKATDVIVIYPEEEVENPVW